MTSGNGVDRHCLSAVEEKVGGILGAEALAHIALGKAPPDGRQLMVGQNQLTRGLEVREAGAEWTTAETAIVTGRKMRRGLL